MTMRSDGFVLLQSLSECTYGQVGERFSKMLSDDHDDTCFAFSLAWLGLLQASQNTTAGFSTKDT